MIEIMKRKNLYSQKDIPYLDIISEVGFVPVFIIGVPRSGTSLLNHLLAETKGVNFVNAYHVLKYGEILSNYINHKQDQEYQEVQRLIDSFAMETRDVDQIPISPYTPEEYEFILNQSGYRMMVNENNTSLIKEICQKIQYISSDPKRPILLKNPMDSYTFPLLKKRFPNAKMIFIYRDPINSLNSWLKFCIKILGAKNLYAYHIWRNYRDIVDNPLLFNLFNFLGTSKFLNVRILVSSYAFQRAYSSLLKNVGYLPSEDIVSIKYEDLCQDPNTIMQKIINFLEIDLPEKIDFANRVNPRETSLLPDVEQMLNYLNILFQPTIDSLGYSQKSARSTKKEL